MGGMSKTDCETFHNLSHSENETGMKFATSRIGEFGTIFASHAVPLCSWPIRWSKPPLEHNAPLGQFAPIAFYLMFSMVKRTYRPKVWGIMPHN